MIFILPLVIVMPVVGYLHFMHNTLKFYIKSKILAKDSGGIDGSVDDDDIIKESDR